MHKSTFIASMRKRLSAGNFLKMILAVLLIVSVSELGFCRTNDEALRRVKNIYPPYQGEINTAYPLTDEQMQRARVLFGESFAKVGEVAKVLRAEGGKLKLSVVFTMYRSGFKRIQSPQEIDYEYATDSLRVKIAQLNELFKPYSDVIDWELLVSDHGPESSGVPVVERIAREQEALGLIKPGQVKVAAFPDIEGKGGGVMKGMELFLEEDNPPDIVIYIDDDLSADLRQIGLLLGPMIFGEYDIVAGSRSLETSVRPNLDLTLTPEQALMGRVSAKLKNIYLLLPLTQIVKDTQNAFKAYRTQVLRDVLPSVLANNQGFTFDPEIMLEALSRGYTIKEVPMLWVFSPPIGVASKGRWEMVLEFTSQYERIVRDVLGVTTISNEQVQFLKDYATSAIQAIKDGEAIELQMQRWAELESIIDSWPKP